MANTITHAIELAESLDSKDKLAELHTVVVTIERELIKAFGDPKDFFFSNHFRIITDAIAKLKKSSISMDEWDYNIDNIVAYLKEIKKRLSKIAEFV